MSNLPQRHQRTLKLKRLTLDLTLALAFTLELLPHPEIPVPEQLVTATRNPAMARLPLRATNRRGAEVRHYR